MSIAERFFKSRHDLADLVGRFGERRIAVIGDFFLDKYLVIDPELDEPSLETGLVARQVVAVRNSPGAAGTVVNNLAALGAGQLHAIGVIGDDGHGFELIRELERRGVDASRLIRIPERFTPTYTKPMLRRGDAEEELNRIDIQNRAPLAARWEDAVLEHVRLIARHVDAVVILDQVTVPEGGVVTRRVRDGLADIATEHPQTVFYADSRAFAGRFTNVIIKVNQHEALRAAGLPEVEAGHDVPTTVLRAGTVLRERTGRPVVITRSENGILVIEETTESEAPCVPVDGPIDVCGAGDSVSAALVLAYTSGATLPQAAFMGNLVASITIQQIGATGSATPEQVIERFDSLSK